MSGLDLGPSLWVLGAGAAIVGCIWIADAYARQLATRRTRRALERALADDDLQ